MLLWVETALAVCACVRDHHRQLIHFAVDIMDDHTPVDMNDSGVAEPSASETTPSSVADTLNSLDGDPDKPYSKEPPRSGIQIKVHMHTSSDFTFVGAAEQNCEV